MPFVSESQLNRMRRHLRLQNQEILMYQRVMTGLRKGLQMDGLLKLIVNSAREGLGFKRCGIFLLDPDGKTIRLALGVDQRGRFERNKSWFPVQPKKGLNAFSDIVNGYIKYFLTNNLPKRIPDRRWEKELIVLNNAAVPIQIGDGRIIGSLCVDNLFINRPITRSDITILTNYATQIGLAIESLKVYERYVSLSLTDPLTGLNNRRFFERAIDQELKRCQRYGRAFSLLMVDIDHFKRINDAYGHDKGDLVLKHVGEILRDNLRNLDTVARVGGEEFAVLLPETPPNGLRVVINRLLRKMRDSQPPLPEMVLRAQKVTFSLGVASYRQGDVKPHHIVKLADKSLYRAKRTGRNKCGPLHLIAK